MIVIHCFLQQIFQVHSDFNDLLSELQHNDTNICCFEDSNITSEIVSFETTGDAVSATQYIFVSFSIVKIVVPVV